MALACVLACGLANAQQEGPLGGTPKAEKLLEQEIESRISQMRKAIREGLPIVTNVRVSVKLRNAHKIRGVVKQGRFIEKAAGLDFVPADTKTPGAGLRIWYYNDTNSYVFIPFEAIENYRIGQKLTELQVLEIEERIVSERKRSSDARRDYLAAQKRAVEGETGDPAAETPAAGDTPPAAGAAKPSAQEFPLLAEFPPAEGWSEDRLHEIQMRKIVVGAYPDARSQRFIEVFDTWRAELDEHGKQQQASEPAPAPPGAGSGSQQPPAGQGGGANGGSQTTGSQTTGSQTTGEETGSGR